MSNKLVIFISHSSKDAEIAFALREQIVAALELDESRDVFVSSAPDGIDINEDWFDLVVEKLNSANIFIVLISQHSMQSNWVWFEIGHIWANKIDTVYPLVLPGVGKIPHPLNTRQAKKVADEAELTVFFTKLCEDLNGNIENVDLGKIRQLADVTVYPHHTEYDIQEILKDYLKEVSKPTKWFIYAQLDKELGLPKGSSAKYIKDVAEKLNVEIEDEHETGIRFKHRPLSATTKSYI